MKSNQHQQDFAKRAFAYDFHVHAVPRLSDVSRFAELNAPGAVQEICRRLGMSRRDFLLALACGELPNEAMGRWEPVTPFPSGGESLPRR